MKRIIFLFTLLITCINFVFAQQASVVRGKVTTSDGQPADAVSVGVKNTSIGTVTSQSGTFQFRLKPGTYVIHVSAVGLLQQDKTITVASGQTTTVDFVLKQNANELKEVIMQSALYCGLPAANAAFQAAQDVLNGKTA